ncbi:MAG: RND family transporter [Planctomycetaceae bacterium]
MTHFFERRDPWGHGMALWVLMILLFVIPPAVWSVTRIDMENDVENWLPASDPHAKTLEWYRSHFSSDNRVLITWDGSTLGDARVNRLAHKLTGTIDENGRYRNGLPQIATVTTPGQIIEKMKSQGIEPVAAVRSISGLLVGRGPMNFTLTDAGKSRKLSTTHELGDAVKQKLGITLTMVSDRTDESEAIAAESTDDAAATELAASIADSRTVDFAARWPQMQFHPEQIELVQSIALELKSKPTPEHPAGEPLIAECFFVPGSPVAISVTLSEAGKADRAGALKSIREAAVEVGIPADALHLAGHAVAETALNQEVKKVAWNPAYSMIRMHRRSAILLSAIVGIVIAAVVLRSLRLAGLIFAVSACTILLSLALVPATSGSMNTVLIVLPTLLWVVTIAAAIHVINYWRHTAASDGSNAVIRAMKLAKRPILWAGLTTAIGLMSLQTSPLAPVKQLGWYGALGCLISLVLVLYVLPALLQFLHTRVSAPIEFEAVEWKGLGDRLWKFRIPVMVGSMMIFAAGTYGLRGLQTESRVLRFFPDDAQIVKDYQFVEEELAGITPVELILRFDEGAQQRLNFLERLQLVSEVESNVRKHSAISGVFSLGDFQTVIPPAEGATAFIRKARFNSQANAVEEAVRESTDQTVKTFYAVAKDHSELEGSTPQRLSTAGDELWRITAQVSSLKDTDYGALTNYLDMTAQSTLKKHAGAGHVVTGMVPMSFRTQEAVRQSLIKSFAITFGVITISMMFLLGSPSAGLLAIIPNVLPVGMVFGLLSWFNMSADPGTMVTAAVALGIAVGNTLHLLTWFQHSLEQGLSRRDAALQALTRCCPAMWQTSSAIGLGLLMLAPVDLLVISRFGLLMAALIGSTLVANIVLLPILLVGMLGGLLEKRIRKGTVSEATAPAATAEPESFSGQHYAPAPVSQPHFKVITNPSHSGRKIRVD